ncbi:MAG TPA: thioredoxin family protein [Pseudonocardiaceae bacterium]
MTGLWITVGVLAAASLLGLLLRSRDGLIRWARVGTPSRDGGEPPVAKLPEPVRELLDPATPVTLVQISTTFCAPCRHARLVLADLASRVDGLRHVDLDVTNQPEVATGLGVLRTPTTIALAPDGTELLRVGGVPKRESLLAALRPYLPEAAASVGSVGESKIGQTIGRQGS